MQTLKKNCDMFAFRIHEVNNKDEMTFNPIRASPLSRSPGGGGGGGGGRDQSPSAKNQRQD